MTNQPPSAREEDIYNQDVWDILETHGMNVSASVVCDMAQDLAKLVLNQRAQAREDFAEKVKKLVATGNTCDWNRSSQFVDDNPDQMERRITKQIDALLTPPDPADTKGA